MKSENIEMYAWGYSSYGQTGKSDVKVMVYPIKVFKDKSSTRGAIDQMACGEFYSITVHKGVIDSVFAFGSNFYGELGLGNTSKMSTPGRITALNNLKVRSVHCGSNHSFALVKEKQLFGWGFNLFGQLGLGNFNQSVPSPTAVPLPFEGEIDQIACGGHHSLISSENRIYSTGFGKYFALGTREKENLNSFTEIHVSEGKLTSLAAGLFHSAAIVDSKKLYCWGEAEALKFSKPTLIDRSVKDILMEEVKIGKDFIVVLKSDGTLYSMGDSTVGRLGRGITARNHQNKLCPIEGIEGKIAQFSLGLRFGVAVTTEGKVFGWGDNGYKQNPEHPQDWLTKAVQNNPATNLKSTAVVAGGYHCLAMCKSSFKIEDQDVEALLVHENLNLPCFIKAEARKEGFMKGLSIKKKSAELSRKSSIQMNLPRQNAGYETQSEINRLLKDIEVKKEEVDLGKRLGNGTFGVVYLAFWKGIQVAAKVIRVDNIDKQELKGLEMEIEIMKNISHPRILGLFGYFKEKNEWTLLIELCESGDLFHFIHCSKAQLEARMGSVCKKRYSLEKGDEVAAFYKENKRNLIKIEKVRILKQIAEGMAVLHSLDNPIIHRDLKSLNIMLDDNYDVKIGDFGTAKQLTKEEEQYLTQGKGTLQWMAPEVINTKQYNESSDVFSYAIVMHEVMTTDKPYPGIDGNTVRELVMKKEGFRPNVSKEEAQDPVFKCMQRCWDDDPEKRPRFEEVATFLQEIEVSLRKRLE